MDLRDFVLGEVTALVFAVFLGIQIVIGAVRPLAHNAEGTVLHALDLVDLFEESLKGQWCIREGAHIFANQKNGPNSKAEEICPAHRVGPQPIRGSDYQT